MQLADLLANNPEPQYVYHNALGQTIEHADIYDAVTLSRALDWAVDWYFMDKGLE